MIVSIAVVFFQIFVFGLALSLLVLRRTDLGPNLFRLIGILGAVFSLAAFLLSGPERSFTGLSFASILLWTFYASTVNWLPTLLERGFLLLAAFLAGWASVHAMSAPGWTVVPLLSGGVLLGSSLVAMNVGHSYLSMESRLMRPLRRTTGLLAVALACRGIWVLAVVPALAFALPSVSEGFGRMKNPTEILWVTVALARILFGLVGPALLTYWTWQTVKLKSTQSATGILYALLVMVLIGETCAIYMNLSGGFPA